MLVDQLLRTGNYTAAQKLAESSAVEVLGHCSLVIVGKGSAHCYCVGFGGYGHFPGVPEGGGGIDGSRHWALFDLLS